MKRCVEHAASDPAHVQSAQVSYRERNVTGTRSTLVSSYSSDQMCSVPLGDPRPWTTTCLRRRRARCTRDGWRAQKVRRRCRCPRTPRQRLSRPTIERSLEVTVSQTCWCRPGQGKLSGFPISELPLACNLVLDHLDHVSIAIHQFAAPRTK